MHFRRRCSTLLVLGLAWAFSPGHAGAQSEEAPLFLPASALEAVLPQSSVYDILEDRQGFLWFATREGVARWDGRHVRSWRHDPFDEASVPGNVVRTLIQDRRGDIWVTAYDYLQVPVGVARIIAPGFTEVRRYGHAGVGIALTPSGDPLLIDSDSFWVRDPRTDRFVRWAPRARLAARSASSFSPPRSVLTEKGWLWIRDADGLERCRLRDPPECELLWESPGGPGGPLLRGSDGTVWVGAGSGLSRFHPEDPDPDSPDRIEIGTRITSLAEDAEGVVWALSEAGVHRVVGGEPRRPSVLPVEGERSTLAPIVLHVDRAQTVWVGTVWGVFMHQRARKAFHHLEHVPDDPNSLSSGLVASLAEASDGSIWMGTIGGGLNRWDRRTGLVERFGHRSGDPSSLADDVVWDLEIDGDGTLWVATGNGLSRLRAGSRTFRTFRPGSPTDALGLGSSPMVIHDLQMDDDERLWLACATKCGDGLAWFDPVSGSFRGLASEGPRRPGYTGLAPDGTIWVGTADGIDLVDPGTGRRTALPDGSGLDGALAFHFSPDGGAWVGANSGLYRFGPDHRLVSRYSAEDGLPSNAVYGVLEDERRRLWLSTNRGLAVIDPDEPWPDRVRAYDLSTGLVNVEFNRNAFLEARDGTFIFGGDKGLTWFHPGRIRDNPYAPPVVVTAFERAGAGEGSRESLGPAASVRVDAADHTFGFEFAALSYVNPHRNRYRTMLEGFDDGWRDLGTAGRVTYTNVPPGRYVFRVEGANEDDVWGEGEGKVVVVVEPWLWETAWFRTLALLLLAGSVAAVAVLLSRARYRAELSRVRAEGALQRERARLSRDMHDEVGASLTEIAILSDVAVAHTATPAPVVDRLKRIGRKSRDAIDSIAGIIWAIDPADDGRSVGAHLREYAGEVLDSAGLEADLDVRVSEGVEEVPAEVRRALRLVLKEALANVIRHAHATRVSVAFTLGPEGARLRIADDGCGLSPEGQPEPGSGHDGLRNMRHRAEAAGGVLEVRTGEDGGTVVRLSVPLGGQA